MKIHNRASVIFLLLTLSFTGCFLIPRNVSMDDPRIQPLLKAAAKFDRTAYGFTPIPKVAEVRWESRPRSTYDAMLHISSKTSRTIAFRKTDDGYRWIGDQETFQGPRMYKDVDGTFHEEFTLTSKPLQDSARIASRPESSTSTRARRGCCSTDNLRLPVIRPRS